MTALQYIIRATRHRSWLFFATVLMYIVEYCLFMVPPLIGREILNSLSGAVDVEFGLETLILLLVISEALKMASFYGILAGEVTYYHSVWSMIRFHLLERILNRPGARPIQISSGEAINRFRDDASAIQSFYSSFYNLAAYTAFATIAVIIMLRINATLTALIFIPMCLVAFLAERGRSRVEGLRESLRVAAEKVSGALGEMFGGVMAIKLAGAESRLIHHFDKINKSRRSAALKDSFFSELLRSVFNGITTVGGGLILLVAAGWIQAGTFKVGDFTLFVFYLGWVTELPSFAGLMMAVMQQVNVSKDRLTELLQGESPLPGKVRQEVVITGPLQSLKEIKIEGLVYHYPDTGRGIEKINLYLPRGSLTVITGRIGSGKTTLLRALLGLLPLEAGSIQWNGQRVEDPAKFFIPPKAAYTPQVPRLFSETLQDNILMGLPFNERIETAIHTSVLEPDLVQMEQGLDTMVGPRGVRLSGGQLQRVAIARMLMRDTELLVMDVVSSALDVETEKLFWERMNSRPSTLLVVSHRPAVLARADHILVMKEGQIDSEGRLNDLLECSDEMRELWRMEKVQ